MALRAYGEKAPRVDPTAYVETSAQLIGDVTLGARSSVWHNAVVRGDVQPIAIGEETNIQDLCCLHVTRERHALALGNRVTVGHGAQLHGCRVDDGCLIGIGAIVLDGAEIGEGSMIAAGALVVPGTRVPPGSLVMGSPACVRRSLDAAERLKILESAAHYVEYARICRAAG
jgi:carbonic anhydrase/acetyltransferase-like protein (isoleucine patch superfamily)